MKKPCKSKEQHRTGELKSLSILGLTECFSLMWKKHYFMKLADISGTEVSNWDKAAVGYGDSSFVVKIEELDLSLSTF